MQSEAIRSKKDNRVIKVKDFRKRTKFDDRFKLLMKVKEEEILRLDRLSVRLFGNEHLIGTLVDTNEKDVLSLEIGESVAFISANIVD